MGGRRHISKANECVAAQLYESGGTVGDIARTLGVSVHVIDKALRRQHVERRAKTVQRKFYPARSCSRCGATHTRTHAYCAECIRKYLAKRKGEGEGPATPLEEGGPPPPPPGFRESDLETGKPLY